MKDDLQGRYSKYLGLSALIIWFILNLISLTAFPALHSDESWLSGLTMEMIRQGRPDVTEPFFDLYPRHPHALKLIYHFLQIPFLLIGAYNSFSVRLLSLICAALTLPLFHGLLKELETENERSRLPLLISILMALDIQFISAAHTGRQEMLLLLVQILILRLYLKIRGGGTAMLTGLAAGMAAGIHPNAFILAWTPGLLLLGDVLLGGRKKIEGLLFLAGGILGAGFFASLSVLFNPNFILDYLAYGSPLGVTRGIDEKILQLPRFLAQLFRRQSGTYYIPDIRPQIILFPLLLIPPLFLSLKRLLSRTSQMGLAGRAQYFLESREDRMILAGTIGTLTGIVLVGKYSQPSILFLLPLLYLGVHRICRLIPRRAGMGVYGVLVLLLLGFTVQNIRQEILPFDEKESYREFRTALHRSIGGEGNILGGLNTAYAFDHGRLYDYRNLPLLKEQGIAVEEYIREREIKYIIHTDELAFVYQSRPVWNALYGNPSHWYPQLVDFLENHCVLEDEFYSPSYGTRIQAYRYHKDWNVKVYRVLPASESSE